MGLKQTTLLLTAILVSSLADAMTIVPIRDSDLVDRAAVVAEVTIESQLPPAHVRPRTDWLVLVERVLKGTVDASRVVVTVPGGEAADGRSFHIYGAPPLAPGRRAIVFLRPLESGGYALADFPQGVFFDVRSSFRGLAVRDFSEVNVIQGGRVGQREPLRDFDRFAAWIEDRANGRQRLADYVVQPRASELSTITGNYSFFTAGGLRLRWFEFNNGASVSWSESSTPLPNLAGGGTAEFQRALAAWTNEATTPIRLVYAGKTTKTGGLAGESDGTNAILWTDPNDEIEGKFSCNQGGTLAYGGPWYSSGYTGQFDGKTYLRILEADVVVNDGFECQHFYSASFSKLVEEVVAHELGHTLGLGHSSENPSEPSATLRDALMYYRAKDDGRGAALKADDIAALQSLYRVGGPIGAGGSGSAKCAGGVAGDSLCFLNGRFRVSLTWHNQFNGTSGFGHPIFYSDLAGLFYFDADPNNIELVVRVVNYAGQILVSYSELTRKQFQLKVTDSLTGTSKVYSNTPDDCGGIDTDFLASGQTPILSTGPPGAPIRDLGMIQPPGQKCTNSQDRLCLLNNRYAVTVPRWFNPFNSTEGAGSARSLTNYAGGFHFSPDRNDLNIFVKIVQYPGNILAFYGALTSFEYRIRITDTTTGRAFEFQNPAHAYCGGLAQHIEGFPVGN